MDFLNLINDGGIRIIQRSADHSAIVKALDIPCLDLSHPVFMKIVTSPLAVAGVQRGRISGREKGGRASANVRNV